MIRLSLSHDVELRAAAAPRSQARGRLRGAGVFAGARGEGGLIAVIGRWWRGLGWAGGGSQSGGLRRRRGRRSHRMTRQSGAGGEQGGLWDWGGTRLGRRRFNNSKC